MRLPLITEIDSRDGTANKDERLTNVLVEIGDEAKFAAVRPGLSLDAQASGVGNGLVVFNNELVSVYGTTLGISAATMEWQTYTLGTYTIVDDSIQTIEAADGISSFLVFNSRLYSTTNGQTITDLGALYDNGTGGALVTPKYFNTSTNLWYAIEETYDIDFGQYTYTFDTSADGLVWSQVGAYDTANGDQLFSIGTDIFATQADLGRPVYKSTNGGATFSNVGTLPSALVTLEFCVNIDGTVFVCGQKAGNTPRVQYTTDGVNYSVVDLPFDGTLLGLAKYNGVMFVLVFNTIEGTIDTYSCNSLSAFSEDYDASDSYSYSVFGQTTVGLNYASGNLIHTYSVPSGMDGTIKTKVIGVAISPLSTIATGNYDFAQSPT